MRTGIRLRRATCTVSALLLSACADKDITAPKVSANQVIASVTPALATQLDANGKFIFGEPAPAGVEWITADRARQLAVGYWTGYGPSLRPQLEKRRKAGIAHNLTPCRRVFLSESGYDPFPAEFLRTYRRTLGAMWLVSLCSGGEQQVAIAVSVEATDLTIDEDGIVRGAQTGDFFSEGVPPGTNHPLEPELGAVDIAESVSSRIAVLPRFRRFANRGNAFAGNWEYQLESRVQMRGDRSGANVDTNVVTFTRWSSLFDLRPAIANQDSAGKTRSEIFSVSADGTNWTTVEVLRRVDTPVSLETFVRTGAQ